MVNILLAGRIIFLLISNYLIIWQRKRTCHSTNGKFAKRLDTSRSGLRMSPQYHNADQANTAINIKEANICTKDLMQSYLVNINVTRLKFFKTQNLPFTSEQSGNTSEHNPRI